METVKKVYLGKESYPSLNIRKFKQKIIPKISKPKKEVS